MSHITSTERFAKAGPYTYTYPMKNTLIGYARCSTDKQDLSAQGQALFNLGGYRLTATAGHTRSGDFVHHKAARDVFQLFGNIFARL